MRDFFRLSCLAALTVLTAILTPLLLAHTAATEEPAKDQSTFRHVSYNTAWKSSNKTGLPMLLFVTMDGCHYCQKMKRESYDEPHISEDINKRFETVVVNKSVDPKLVSQLGVRIFPTTLVVFPGGKIVDRIEGYVGPKELVFHLRPTKRTAQVQPTPPNTVIAKQR